MEAVVGSSVQSWGIGCEFWMVGFDSMALIAYSSFREFQECGLAARTSQSDEIQKSADDEREAHIVYFEG